MTELATDIKGGKETNQETLYEKVGKLKGMQEAVFVRLGEIKDNLDKLWERFDINQNLTKQSLQEHADGCSAKADISKLKQDKESSTSQFRWLVGVFLAVITIIVSLIALKIYH